MTAPLETLRAGGLRRDCTPVAVCAGCRSPQCRGHRDASRDGDITGYLEPLLNGRRPPEGDFNVPVLGPPRGLYTLDWTTVPAAQRRGVIAVRAHGSTLAVLPGRDTRHRLPRGTISTSSCSSAMRAKRWHPSRAGKRQ